MAFTVGTATPHSGSNTGTAVTHTVGSGVTLSVITLSYFGADAASAVTFAGSGATKHLTATSAAVSCDIFYVNNPASGATTVTPNFPGGTRRWVMHVYDVTSTLGSITLRAGTPATGTGTAISVSTPSASGELVIDAVGIRIGTTTVSLTVDASQTQLGNVEMTGSSATNGHRGALSHETATGASTTMSWTRGDSDNWAIAAVALQEVAASALVPRLALLGVG